MMLPLERAWWKGQARRRLPPEVLEHVRRWKTAAHDGEIRRFDARSRIKVLVLFAGFFLTLWGYELRPESGVVTLAAVAAVGAFLVPYTRIFMHSQMHWGMGGMRLTRFLLDRLVSLLFSVPQTGYAIGHRMHHRFDNDFDASGRPRDLQSTYLFSRSAQPTSMLVWIPYYMFIFQHAVVPWLVFTQRRLSAKLWYLVELGCIAGFHAMLFRNHTGFYVHVYVPGLLLAWFGSAMVLYMMHAVDATSYVLHPTNTSVSSFFNTFGDNDGYHLEHTLFSSLHPIHLRKLHAMLDPSPEQVFKDHYFIAGMKRALGLRPACAGLVGMERAPR